MFTHKITERQADQIRRNLWALKQEQAREDALRNGTWLRAPVPTGERFGSW